MTDQIFKITSREAWSAAQRSGALERSAADLRDGYVHLSSGAQVRETAARHFAGQADLLLLALEPMRLPPGALPWEVSRGGALFPHLYGDLRPEYVSQVWDLPLGEDGLPLFPAHLLV